MKEKDGMTIWVLLLMGQLMGACEALGVMAMLGAFDVEPIPDALVCPEPGPDNEALAKIVEDQIACRVDACHKTFEKWQEGREYPCPLLARDNKELKLALDRKCEGWEGRISDCQHELSQMEDQLVSIDDQLTECTDLIKDKMMDMCVGREKECNKIIDDYRASRK